MNNFLCKERSKVYHAYKVNHWKELVETWHLDGGTIVGLPFCDLKGVGNKTMEILYDTKPNQCQSYAIEFVTKNSAQLYCNRFE